MIIWAAAFPTCHMMNNSQLHDLRLTIFRDYRKGKTWWESLAIGPFLSLSLFSLIWPFCHSSLQPRRGDTASPRWAASLYWENTATCRLTKPTISKALLMRLRWGYCTFELLINFDGFGQIQPYFFISYCYIDLYISLAIVFIKERNIWKSEESPWR